jgi:hypothetical protein
LPLLPTGNYTVQAQSVDVHNHASSWRSETFTIESAPVVTFDPLTNSETVFDFSQLGGTINEAGTVAFRIERYDATSGITNLYWNGSAFITNGNDPSVYLAATVTDGIWAPANGVTLPTRCQARSGFYLLRVVATDVVGDASTNEILVTRSAPDTTPPIVTLDTIQSGEVFTNHALPGLSGSALDYESGVASVTVYLNRFTSSGVLYWDGANWTSTSAALPLSYNAQTVAWQVNAPLPSGANLPNAGYQVQGVASANMRNVAGGCC